ncbi:hypothetical protein GCM10023165_12810 [Variovorax defluvii]|uniref:SH3b domain-containing protein n=1 Tax=Variovorax defluvii TaxID=913761 RepID=A0ABP8H8V6_9BURK
MKSLSGRRWIRIVAIGVLAAALPLAAAAQEALSRSAANLRAGPSGDYPVVARLGPGQPFDVLGCTSGYRWCDVVLPDGLRGWLYAGNIDYAYERRRVPLASYGAIIGVPIVGFTIGNYWSDHYRDRPWYREPRWWDGRPPPPVAGWRPVPAPRPDWRPNPWHDRDPGYRPRPDPGFRPQPGWQPPPGPRPPPEHGIRPPRPERDVRPPRPDHPGARPPQFGQPPAMPPGRPPMAQPAPPAAFPPGSVPRAAADMRQRQMDRINQPQSPSADRP